jgi:hypothetical protein
MTDEERQRAMDFIVAQSAKHAVEIDQLLEWQREAERRFQKQEHRFDRDERILKLMIKAGRRARENMRGLDLRMKEIAEFQAHSDKRLDALIDIVRARENGRSS